MLQNILNDAIDAIDQDMTLTSAIYVLNTYPDLTTDYFAGTLKEDSKLKQLMDKAVETIKIEAKVEPLKVLRLFKDEVKYLLTKES